jgi:hypothetical protein
MSQRIVYPVFTCIVVMEDSHPPGSGWHDLLWHEMWCCMCRSSIDGGPRGCGAQGIGVDSHMDGDVLHLYFTSAVYDLEGDIARRDIEPELLW